MPLRFQLFRNTKIFCEKTDELRKRFLLIKVLILQKKHQRNVRKVNLCFNIFL